MTKQLEKYFFDVAISCPYGFSCEAIYRQAQFSFMPEGLMSFFLDKGFRRNGNYLYTMVCKDCHACVPIRLDPRTFTPNRNQKRVIKKNQDLEVKIGPLQITNEKLAICDKFLRNRFPGKGNSALEYYAGFFVNTFEQTFEVEFWFENHLVGVSIVDIFEDTINCVYFYFDPAEHGRSPGTYNILHLNQFAKENNIQYVYLGYLIKEVAAMNYKARFQPHSLFINGKWQSTVGQ